MEEPVNGRLEQRLTTRSGATVDIGGGIHSTGATTGIETIFLDRNLLVTRFIPSATGPTGFLFTDIGRGLSDLTHELDYPQINTDACEVLETLAGQMREVRHADGRWFLIRMSPHHSDGDMIDGIVITFVDITGRREVEDARTWLAAMVESSSDAIISVTPSGNVASWNGGAERIFGYRADEIRGYPKSILTPHGVDGAGCEMFDRWARGEGTGAFDTVLVRKDGTLIDVSLALSMMRNEAGTIIGATVFARDISERKKTVDNLKQAHSELEIRVRERTEELHSRVRQLARLASELTLAEQRERLRMAQILHDDLQQLLVAAKMKVELLHEGQPGDAGSDGARAIALIDEALQTSRSLAVDLSPPILRQGLGRALEWLCGSWMKGKYDLLLHWDIDPMLDTPHEDTRTLVFLAVRELLFNVVKHSTVKEAWVTLVPVENGMLEARVRDHGVGFLNEDVSSVIGSGSGFGLIGLQERLRMLGAELDLVSAPGSGVEAIIRAPRAIS